MLPSSQLPNPHQPFSSPYLALCTLGCRLGALFPCAALGLAARGSLGGGGGRGLAPLPLALAGRGNFILKLELALLLLLHSPGCRLCSAQRCCRDGAGGLGSSFPARGCRAGAALALGGRRGPRGACILQLVCCVCCCCRCAALLLLRRRRCLVGTSLAQTLQRLLASFSGAARGGSRLSWWLACLCILQQQRRGCITNKSTNQQTIFDCHIMRRCRQVDW